MTAGNTTAGIYDLEFYTDNGSGLVQAGRIDSTGGMVWGTPTGDQKGSGTINAQAVYDDNTLLTCYVFDQEVDGLIDLNKWNKKGIKVKDKKEHEPAKKFKSRISSEYNPLDIDKYAQHWKDKKHLTSMPNEDKFGDENPLSTGAWIQRLVETVEIQAVHIETLNQRLKTLEKTR